MCHIRASPHTTTENEKKKRNEGKQTKCDKQNHLDAHQYTREKKNESNEVNVKNGEIEWLSG